MTRKCVTGCRQVLREVACDHSIKVLVYCFMPGRLHLLLENSHGVDMFTFMRRFKSWSTRMAWDCGWHGKLWHRSYYDHLLREGEDVTSHIRYILGNPVRHELVATWNEYEWSGSFEFDFSDAADWPL